VKDLHREPRRSGASVAGGSLTREMSGRVGAAATKPGRSSTARWVGSGKRDAGVYERNRRFTSRNESPARNLADLGRARCAPAPSCRSGELPERSVFAGPEGHGEGLRHSRGDVAGTESGAYCDKRSAVNTGTVPVPPLASRGRRGRSGLGPSSADRAGTGRSRRSTRSRGKPGHRGKGGSGFEKGRMLQCRKTRR
jgi:hypothetical protein